MFERNVYTLANFLQFITHCPRLVRLWCQRFADFIAIFMTSSKHRVNLACAVRLVKLKNGKWHGSDGDKPVRNLILSILFVIVLIDLEYFFNYFFFRLSGLFFRVSLFCNALLNFYTFLRKRLSDLCSWSAVLLNVILNDYI